MFVERVHEPLKSAALDNFLIIHGSGVLDSFVSTSYNQIDFSHTLHHALKELGFERIVFFALQQGLFFYDEKSRTFSMPRLSTPPAASQRRGVLGDLTQLRRPTAPAGGGRSPAMSHERALSLINSFMRESAPRTAIVFLRCDDLFRHIETKALLYDYCNQWVALPSGQENLCCYVFDTIAYDELLDRIRDFSPAMAARLAESDGRSAVSATTRINIGAPPVTEIRRLLARMRLLAGTVYDFVDIERLSEKFAQRGAMLREWQKRFNHKKIDREQARKDRWLESALSDKSASERLNELIGLESVKARLKEFEAGALISRKINSAYVPMMNMIFQGNPGTGKTTVARLVGEMLHEMGLLKRGHVREVKSLQEITGEYEGTTAPRMNKVIDEALDGVLFIDEAYQLGGDDSLFAKQARETLLPAMENNADRLCVIFAGYPNEMQELLDSNPGFRRRFPTIVDFPDYKPLELNAILESMLLGRSIPVSEEFIKISRDITAGMYAMRDKSFGNAGAMRNFADAVQKCWSLRCCNAQLDPTLTPLQAMDVPAEYVAYAAHSNQNSENETLESILGEMNRLVGMEAVRKRLETMMRLLIFDRNRGKKAHTTLHILFRGNPGTGKTTVARQIARIYHAMGYIEKAICEEVKPSEIIGQYVGQTEQKAEEIFKKAKGGILFLDEAYTYANESFGHTSFIEMLVSFMEDNRDSTAVIAAGYPDRMEEFLNLNSGLKSRFDQILDFPDYTARELSEIVAHMAEDDSIGYPLDVAQRVEAFMELARNEKDFGNGRSARNLFIRMRENLAMRVGLDAAAAANPVFSPEDVPELV